MSEHFGTLCIKRAKVNFEAKHLCNFVKPTKKYLTFALKILDLYLRFYIPIFKIWLSYSFPFRTITFYAGIIALLCISTSFQREIHVVCLKGCFCNNTVRAWEVVLSRQALVDNTTKQLEAVLKMVFLKIS